MARFEDAIGLTLEHEGFDAYTDDPVDPGGATKWGLSLRFLRADYPDLDLDDDGDLDADDVRLIDQATAWRIYRRSFWDRYLLDWIDSQVIANKLFDTTVNTGPRQTGFIVQRALQACQRPVAIDGILGPQTRSAINRIPSARLIVGMRSEQGGFYRLLIAQKPALGKYRNGWERRAYA